MMKYTLYLILAWVLHAANGGYDFRIYMRAVDRWLTGAALYTDGFYYAPWFLPVLLPFKLLGFTGWAFVSIVALFYILDDIPARAKLIVLFAPAIMSDLSMGQINLLLLAFLLYAERCCATGRYYRAGWCLVLLAIKPVSLIVPFFYLFLRYRRHAHALAIPTLAVFAASLILWPGWVPAYVANLRNVNPLPVISVWHLGRFIPIALLFCALVALHTWRAGDRLNATIIANLALTPYAVPSHLALLLNWMGHIAAKYPALAILGLVCWRLLLKFNA